MGLKVERKKDLFRLTSTVSDERLHDEEWIPLNDAKRILINRALWDFMRKAIEIHLEFPAGYSCDGRYIPHEPGAPTDTRWMLDNAYGEGGTDRVIDKFKEIVKELELGFDIDVGDDD